MRHDIQMVEGRRRSRGLSRGLGSSSGGKPWYMKWWVWALAAGALYTMFKGGSAVVTYVGKQGFAKMMDGVLAALGLSQESRLIAIAQAGVETQMGTQGKAISGNNFWNMSAGTVEKPSSDWSGPVILGPDKEPDGNGGWKAITQRWRSFATPAEAAQHWLEVFLGKSRYAAAKAALLAGNSEAFLQGLFAGGYFTWPIEDFTDANGKAQYGYRSMFNGQYKAAKQYLGLV